MEKGREELEMAYYTWDSTVLSEDEIRRQNPNEHLVASVGEGA